MKLIVKENVNLNELYYQFEDLKKSSKTITDKYYYDEIYNLLKYDAEYVDVTSVFDAVLKNYVIINVSTQVNENINEYFFYNYVYVYFDNILTKKTGNIKYKNFMFNPLLNYYKRYIQHVSLFRNQKSMFKIKYRHILNSLDLSYNTIHDNSKIINFVNDINKIDFFDYKIYNNKTFLQEKMEYISNNFGYNVKNNFTSFINERFSNIHYIVNNIKIALRDSHYLYIINKYFNSADLTKFINKYNINKNISNSLSDKDFDFVKLLHDKEQKHLCAIENNTCEHIAIYDKGDIDTIVKLYIKDSYDIMQLHKHNNRFICKKCGLPLICPHNVHKHIYPKKNLNSFVNVEDSLKKSVYCKICGEFLWSNNIYAKYAQDRDYTYRDLFDLGNTDNIDQMIYRILFNYFLSKNILHKKKNIRNESILSFVKNHIYYDVDDQFNEINKSITSNDLAKTTQKSLILYIYVFCSIIYLAIHNNKLLTLFDAKVSHIDKIISKCINEIKTANKYAIVKYSDSQLNRIVYVIYDKLSKKLPTNINLYEVDINFIKYNNMRHAVIYNYILLINSIYFGKNLDIEFVFNTSLNDININFNNIFIPTLSFLVKNGGKDIEPFLKNENQLTNTLKQTFVDFINNDIVYSYLKDNKNYIALSNNLKNIKYDKKQYNKAYDINLLKEKLNTKNSLRYQTQPNVYKYNIVNSYIYEKIDNILYFKYNIFNEKEYSKQLTDINTLLNTSIKKINIYDMLNIISHELAHTDNIFNINNDDEQFISQRIKLLSNAKYDINKIIINNDLYKTLLNMKNNNTLIKYYESIVKYIKEYNDIDHNMIIKKKILSDFITTSYNHASADEDFEHPNIDVNEDDGVEHDFGNENFDYDAEYSDEDVNIKENDDHN